LSPFGEGFFFNHSATLLSGFVDDMSLQPLKLVESGSLKPLKLQRIDIEVQCDAFLSRTRPKTNLLFSKKKKKKTSARSFFTLFQSPIDPLPFMNDIIIISNILMNVNVSLITLSMVKYGQKRR
jgi:hypothetical protein